MELKIQKTDKIIIIFYVFLAITFTIGIFYIASTFDTIEHTIKFPEPVTELQITKIVDVNQEKAFLIMTDVKIWIVKLLYKELQLCIFNSYFTLFVGTLFMLLLSAGNPAVNSKMRVQL